MSPEVCPHCGATLPRKAKVCPECGSDENTGWSDSAHADNLGIPEEHFDYDEFVKEEFGSRNPKPKGIHWIWWITAIIVVVAFLYFIIR